eukprot:gnl/TRDRNA2_/TRDRNA2_199357_c0_seq1.p1 gnl/TRDRNA2_/TRDRNA2_199357_c0~~gnl/TRDRNA2_/TRDRNA2_199357_c0_seq1.p1  ORF type:complete len:162 (+),score=19.81 gnl/TRDRNA2_/TRDRNA2_199357_c0_seq1:70-555(+)
MTNQTIMRLMLLAYMVVPLMGCATPSPANCGSPQDFSLDTGGCAQFSDIPSGAAKCSISAGTSTTGSFCWFPSGQDVSLCFDSTCYGTGVSSPNISGWQKNTDQTVLTVTNLHVSECGLDVSNFKYCCTATDSDQEDVADGHTEPQAAESTAVMTKVEVSI